MAKSSIHIEKGNIGFLFHNDRSKATMNTIFDDEKNEILNDAKTALKIYNRELKIRAEKYTQNTKKKLHKKAITHLSAIVNLNQHHTMQDLLKLKEYLEEELDTKVFQIAIHRDEGHTDEQGNKIKNYHAHIEFLGLDSQGKSIRRKLDRKFLINLQTKVAEILKMERGINYTKERKKRIKRLNTYEYKEHAKRQAIKVKELKEEIENYRKKIIELNKKLNIFGKEDYKAINDIKKITKKDTLQDALNLFLKVINSHKQKIAKLQKENKELQDKRILLEQENEILKFKNEELKEKSEFFQNRNNFLEQENEILKFKNEELKQENEKLKNENKKLQEKIKELEQEIELLKQKNNAFLGMNESIRQELKEKEEELIKLKDKIKYIIDFEEEFGVIKVDGILDIYYELTKDYYDYPEKYYIKFIKYNFKSKKPTLDEIIEIWEHIKYNYKLNKHFNEYDVVNFTSRCDDIIEQLKAKKQEQEEQEEEYQEQEEQEEQDYKQSYSYSRKRKNKKNRGMSM